MISTLLSYAWAVLVPWFVLSVAAALVWALVRANEERRLPPQPPDPYATPGYRGYGWTGAAAGCSRV